MNRPSTLKRVVYIVSRFPCISETFIAREINALVECGVDVRIISLKKAANELLQTDSAVLLQRTYYPQPLPRAMRQVIATVWRNPAVVARALQAVIADSWRHPEVAAKSVLALFRSLEHAPWLLSYDPQLIHAHWATYPSTAAWALSSVLGRPFSFTCHAHDIFVARQLLARKIHEAALAVTISHHNVDWLREHATARAVEKLKVIHCGVDMDCTPLRSTIREAGMVLAVGRLDPIKGFDTLIDAIAVLKGRGVAINCRLVGSGPMKQALIRHAIARRVASQVEFVGSQPQERIRQWMQSASVFVMPSQVAADGNRDGIPVALMEAMASGCPVVSTRVSGIPELIHDGEHGVLVDQRDPVALADAIMCLLDDDELRRRLTSAARARIELKFDARKEAGRLHLLMTEVAHVA